MTKYITSWYLFITVFIFAIQPIQASKAAVTSSDFGLYTWAIDGFAIPGSGLDGFSPTNGRLDIFNALGTPDQPSTGDPAFPFISLGKSGLAIFDFGVSFSDSVVIFETTYATFPFVSEEAEIYVSNNYDFASMATVNLSDVSTWTMIGIVPNAIAQDGAILSGFGGPFRYVAVLDIDIGDPNGTEGFDVNAIGVSAVPIPASLWLFISGIALFGLFRRFKDRA